MSSLAPELVAALSDQDALALAYDWVGTWARPNQLPPPGAWSTWLVLAGRGYGKSRLGAEFIRAEVEAGRARRVALVGRSAADVRDVMIEGESGILACSPPWCRPLYEPSKRRLSWPSGAVATAYSADEPDQLRGPQHDLAWADELAAWSYPDAWDQLQMGLRLGAHPRQVVTTTPRPTPIIRRLLADASTTTTRGSTYDNAANLAPSFLAEVRRRYDGTRLGRQELYAEILDDTPGALWTRDRIEASRVRVAPVLRRVVVAIDPAVSADEGSDETGIVVAGIDAEGHAFVLADRSGRMSPDAWARAARDARKDHQADRIVAEANQGGAMVELTIRTVDPLAPVRLVHASRGKQARAEPVAALYEQGRVHHVGCLPQLEDQLCTWVPGQSAASPDRLDALVWALTDLVLDAPPTPAIWTL